MKLDIITIFPEYFAPLDVSLLGKARRRGDVDAHVHDLRGWAYDKHRTVDDTPYGGGPGMVMMCQTMFDAVEWTEKQDARPATRVILSPQGRTFDQCLAHELAEKPRLLLISGRYEGFDERIIDGLAPMEVSIGDYVLSGGELAAMVVIDAVVRLIPGVLGAETGSTDESFADGLLAAAERASGGRSPVI